MFLNIVVFNEYGDFDFWDSNLYNDHFFHAFRNKIRNLVSSKMCQGKWIMVLKSNFECYFLARISILQMVFAIITMV